MMSRSRQRWVSAWMLTPNTRFRARSSPRARALRRLPTSSRSASPGIGERASKTVRDPPGVETAEHVEHDVAELLGDGEPLPLAQSSAFTTTTGTGGSPGRRARAARPPTVSSGKASILTARSSSSSTRLGTGSWPKLQWRRRTSAMRSALIASCRAEADEHFDRHLDRLRSHAGRVLTWKLVSSGRTARRARKPSVAPPSTGQRGGPVGRRDEMSRSTAPDTKIVRPPPEWNSEGCPSDRGTESIEPASAQQPWPGCRTNSA